MHAYRTAASTTIASRGHAATGSLRTGLCFHGDARITARTGTTAVRNLRIGTTTAIAPALTR